VVRGLLTLRDGVTLTRHPEVRPATWPGASKDERPQPGRRPSRPAFSLAPQGDGVGIVRTGMAVS
jgi:hypothetical protein